ncbi:MAG: hypothetical protein KJT03_19615, partial [Verrucomicrobiae bacterium]|nr:hypothetical protein [Verrucomicrobiae bacterium]
RDCNYKQISEKIFNAPRWADIRSDDSNNKQLEQILNEILLLDVDCLRKVIQHYEINHYAEENEYQQNRSFATFHLFFYGYCNISSLNWEEFSAGISDTQLEDSSWNPGDPWLLEFGKSGAKIIAYQGSYGGTSGSLTGYFDQLFSKYGKREYFPK